ncbi:MAG: hypothetical protein LBB08_02640, partial [Rickettsiales bacterium]|nr:hypothetical protein [Rickettsiales bacterium]
MFDHNEPGLLMTPVLRDRQGAEYIAHCPQQYEVLDFFDSGRHWRVSKVVKKHSRQRYLLKNLID